jgi:hypothetical protein
MKMNRGLLVGLAVSVPAFSAACAAPPQYRVDDLGAGWGASAMNEHGDVCGNISPDGTKLLAGVSHDGQPFVMLPLPPGMQSSRVHDINNAGVMVGAVAPNQYVISQPIAAKWTPSADGYTVEILPTYPGQPYSAAWAINEVGDILGGAGFFGWALNEGLLYSDHDVTVLPGGTAGTDINDLRVVVAGNTLLNLWTGEIEQIPLPPGNWQGFGSSDINNVNDVCGDIIGFSGCSTFPIRFRQSAGWEFLGGCATTTAATAMNDHGDALVYYYQTTSGVHFVDEGYFQIGALIDPSQGLWFVQWGGANGINNARQIIASARNGLNGPIGAVRLTPITNTCDADITGDGELNFFDVQAFLSLFAVSDLSVDFNNDSTIDFFDVQAFLAAFASGC